MKSLGISTFVLAKLGYAGLETPLNFLCGWKQVKRRYSRADLIEMGVLFFYCSRQVINGTETYRKMYRRNFRFGSVQCIQEYNLISCFRFQASMISSSRNQRRVSIAVSCSSGSSRFIDEDLSCTFINKSWALQKSKRLTCTSSHLVIFYFDGSLIVAITSRGIIDSL